MPADTCKEKFILAMSIITGVIGIAILGISAYVLITYESGGWDSFVDKTGVYMALGVGGGIFLLSGIGCLASTKDSKALLIFYSLILLALIATQIAAAVIIALWSGKLDANLGSTSASLTELVDVTINNGVYSTYQKCCSGCGDVTCVGASPAVWNETTQYCPEIGDCEYVDVCPGVSPPPACFVTTDPLPVIRIDQGVCTVLKTTVANGSAIVGHFIGLPASTSCGRGQAVWFKDNMYAFGSSIFMWAAVGFGVLAGLQLALFLATIGLICYGSDGGK